MKRTRLFLTLSLLIICSGLSSAATFSGFAGIKGDIESDKTADHFDPVMNLTGFFQGQLSLTQNLLFRSELSLKTADVIETKLIDDTEAVFKINELSLTYVKPFLAITQYFSFFFGNFEPVGTGQFLQRQFGIRPINSHITDNFSGLNCAMPFTINGIGGSYVAHVNDEPVAVGLYVYKNEENPEKIKQLNFDLRYGSVFKYLTVDSAIGIGAPLNSKNGSEDVILLIDELFLHTGFDILIGNPYMSSLYLQAGYANMPLKAGSSKQEISSDEIYMIVEPRIWTPKFEAHISFFSLPNEATEKLEFIEKDNTLGLNVNIFTDKLYIKDRDFTFGFHSTLSFKNLYFMDLKHIKEFIDEDYMIKVSPYVSFPVMSGTLSFMLQTKISGFSSENMRDQFKLSIGYKSGL